MKFGEVEILVSTVKDGNMAEKYGDLSDVKNNWLNFFHKNNLDINQLVRARLQGKTDIVKVGLSDIGREIDCDGLYTTEKGVILGFVVADCYPVVVFDESKKTLALLHLGRKGIDDGLVEKALFLFNENGSNQKDLKIIFGPGIKKDSYFWQGDPPHDPKKWGKYLEKIGSNRWKIDTEKFILQKLLDFGVKMEQITLSAIDVCSDKNYFSHVRSYVTGEAEGRFAVMAKLSF